MAGASEASVRMITLMHASDFIVRTSSTRLCGLKLPRSFGREICHDEIRTRAADSEQRLHHYPLPVDPPALGGGADHGVLPAHLVGRDGIARVRFHTRDDVEIRTRGLD